MKDLSREIWKALESLRGSVTADQAIEVLLYDAALHMGMPESESDRTHREWISLKDADAYAELADSRAALLFASPSERLAAIDDLLSRQARADRGVVWISHLPAKRIAELAGDADKVRCAFDAALHPALLLSQQGKSVRFISADYAASQLAIMISTIIEAQLDVVTANPFSRTDEGQFDAEIIMSPFGLRISSGADIPKSTLSVLGENERSRRLSSDPVAVADGLQSPCPRVVVSVYDAMMFRGVGVEPIAREALVESGRLQAVLSVPSGMVFPHTGIATSLLVLGSEGTGPLNVRFVNLSDDRFAGKTVRGRREVKPASSWLEALHANLSDEQRFAADVPVSAIREKDYTLSLERYLLPPAVIAVEAFLSSRRARHLEDVVELIRPLSMGKEEDGEFMIREAVPGDIGDSDFLEEPKKETLIERAQLRKARNQRLAPGDLLLSVKGTIGSVALVPAEAAVDGESGFWTAGQSFMILRPKKSEISSVALYEYLSSGSVKEALRSLAYGAGIPTISIKDLKEFRIPVPSAEEEDEVVAAFQDRQDRLAEVRTILESIEHARDASWPHRELQRARA
ncbi:restriction endonuclease subunit S [Limimaricola litoreus]|uniref:Restriction endonuclease subunit S n=1 Tax=Limimaricola litoreus TaxID=2955316 RepID=A0A9X2FRU6_9RHOB|nr:restriction endonuclease subunit S [Limimaricola litoreus]MCP1168894.1 restriction endonuclease subunit S [Limimaricola litoreus]